MDIEFMKRALELSKTALGYTSPNPAVGAVIVKNNKIIGEGFTEQAGGDHAEVNAIASVEDSGALVGSTLYVTLEPCCHHGKTPPCTDAIIASGITDVVVALKDPFSEVNGRGILNLESHGLKVIMLDDIELADEIALVNQAFLKFQQTKLPYVIMKSGISLDGKITTSSGKSMWITSQASRDDAKRLRNHFDCVLVGAGTVLSDDCELCPFENAHGKQLLRVVVSKDLNLPLDKKIFRDAGVFVATTDCASASDIARFTAKGVSYKSFGDEHVNIQDLLKFLAENLNVRSVLIEGGSNLNGTFFDAALKTPFLLDGVIYYIAPKLIGGKDSLPVIGGNGAGEISDCLEFRKTIVSRVEEDIKVEAFINLYS